MKKNFKSIELSAKKKSGFTLIELPVVRQKGFTLIELPVVSKRGFTLIELLVVIAIISILASMILVSLSVARVKARDARTKGAINGVRTVAQLYNLDNGSYTGICNSASILSLKDDIEKQGGTTNCQSSTTAWAFAAKLPSAGLAISPAICADSKGMVYEYKNDSAGILNYTCASGTQVESFEVQAALEAAPTFSLPAGPVFSGSTVAMNSTRADAIYYTTNGSTPTISSYNQNTTPLVIPSGSTVTVKAIAVKTGFRNSAMSSVVYSILGVGSTYEGGKIFYILQPGDSGYVSGVKHGLIAAANDLPTATWGCAFTSIPGALGSAIGTGSQNTTAIVNGCSTSGTAAKLSYDLVQGGKSDWYLPSKNELFKLRDNSVAVGNFDTGWAFYMMSTEYNSYASEVIYWPDGSLSFNNKDWLLPQYHARSIRSF